MDSSGNAYVAGQTFSANFPTANPIQSALGGGTCGTAPNTSPCPDAFVAKLNPAGSALVYSTYLGGNDNDGGAGIALDSSGNVYVTGATYSANFSTTTGSFPSDQLAGSLHRPLPPAFVQVPVLT